MKLSINIILYKISLHIMPIAIMVYNNKEVGKWMSLCCTVDYKWVTVNLNSMIPIYCPNLNVK